jgi:hypothetical protein
MFIETLYSKYRWLRQQEQTIAEPILLDQLEQLLYKEKEKKGFDSDSCCV